MRVWGAWKLPAWTCCHCDSEFNWVCHHFRYIAQRRCPMLKVEGEYRLYKFLNLVLEPLSYRNISSHATLIINGTVIMSFPPKLFTPIDEDEKNTYTHAFTRVNTLIHRNNNIPWGFMCSVYCRYYCCFLCQTYSFWIFKFWTVEHLRCEAAKRAKLPNFIAIDFPIYLSCFSLLFLYFGYFGRKSHILHQKDLSRVENKEELLPFASFATEIFVCSSLW